jgi:hypothetical protein
MNHEDTVSLDPAREREWQAQERALRAERLGLDPHGDDARVRRYRLLARALREPPTASLPADFASQVAARAARSARARQLRGGSLETVLLAGLPGALVLTGGVALAMYAPSWLPAVRLSVPTVDPQSLHWSLAFAGCLGLSWLLGALKPRNHRTPTPR